MDDRQFDDELGRVLGRGAAPLPPASGTYERIRARARHRRQVRAAGGALVLAGVVVAVPLLTGLGDEREVVIQPVAPQPSPSAPAQSAPPPRSQGPGVSACRAPDLQPGLGRLDAGAGNRYQPLTVTNVGRLTCILQGSPRASMEDAGGTELAVASFEEGNPDRRLELAPGDVASTTLHWASDGNPPCSDAVALQVVPPGESEPLRVPDFAVRVCGHDSFSVRNFVAGPDGTADAAQ